MKKLNKNIINYLSIFIILSPFLDSITYLMRDIFDLNLSLSTIIKPLFMGFIFIILIINKIKNNKKWFNYTIPFIIFGIYSIIHIFLVKDLFFELSYSTLIEEVKRLIQCGYYLLVVINLYIILKENYKKNSLKLIKSLVLSATIYYIIYIISVITGTSEPSYANGVSLGYQGWLNPSHLINHIGVLLSPLAWYLYELTKEKKYLFNFLIIILPCYYLVGTKSGSFGIICVLIMLILYSILLLFKERKKQIFNFSILLVTTIILLLTYSSSYTYKNLNQTINDLEQSEGKTSQKVSNLINSFEEENKLNETQKKYYSNMYESLKYLEDLTINNNLKGANNRQNERIYNSYLFKISDFRYKLFGIGFTNQPNHLYLENDLLASIYNFGIILFILTYLPILIIYLYCLYKLLIIFLKGKIYNYYLEYILILIMSLFLIISYTTGYIFFQPSLIIIFVIVILICLLSLNKYHDTINLKLRFRKYLSKIKRLKNYNSYQKEIEKRKNTSIFDYQELSKDMNESYKELSKDNCLYGIAKCFRDYTNYNGILDSYIEHGANFSSSVYPYNAVYGLENIITLSKRRQIIIQESYPKKNIFAVGPYIHYAKPLYDNKKYKEDKKKLGKTLLVFPSKSIEGVNHKFDIELFKNEIKRIKKEHNIDTVLINIYYYDIQNGFDKYFIDDEFKIVTAGHKLDENFTSRLKYIISLSDITMSNNIGTHIGYCIYMKKPHYLYDQNVEITGKNKDKEFYKERLETYLESEKRIKKVFSKPSFKITDQQRKIVEEFWGISYIKTKKEMLKIFKGEKNEKN